ncbi:hypothetical protein SAMN05443573_1182 [Celeribacter indicus]|nr:hypothetical protein SAMN05443573_1182 [Celeribacter indicus]
MKMLQMQKGKADAIVRGIAPPAKAAGGARAPDLPVA